MPRLPAAQLRHSNPEKSDPNFKDPMAPKSKGAAGQDMRSLMTTKYRTHSYHQWKYCEWWSIEHIVITNGKLCEWFWINSKHDPETAWDAWILITKIQQDSRNYKPMGKWRTNTWAMTMTTQLSLFFNPGLKVSVGCLRLCEAWCIGCYHPGTSKPPILLQPKPHPKADYCSRLPGADGERPLGLMIICWLIWNGD